MHGRIAQWRRLSALCLFTAALLPFVFADDPSARAEEGGEPPELTSLTAVMIDNGIDEDIWEISGVVVSEESVVIEFGGLMEGDSVVPESDGTFLISLPLDPAVGDQISAQARDLFDRTSDVKYHNF